MSKRRKATVLGVLGVHALLGATTALAQDADASEASTDHPDIRPVPARGVMEAGTYASSAVGPETTFSVGEGWVVVYAPVGGLGFAIGPSSGGHLLGIVPFNGNVSAEPCFIPERSMDLYEAQRSMSAWLADPANQITVDTSAEGFWGHLQSNPYLNVGELSEVEIGGFEGLQADVRTAIAEECFPRETVLWVEPAGAWVVRNDAQARYSALDVAGNLVIVAAESAPGLSDHEAHLELDDTVLETLTFTADTQVSED